MREQHAWIGRVALSGVFLFLEAVLLLSLIRLNNVVMDEIDQEPNIVLFVISLATTLCSALFVLPVTHQIGRVFCREATGNLNAFPTYLDLDRNLDLDPFA